MIEILKDGKIDYHDIPQIIIMIVDVICELYDFEMHDEDLKQLLHLLLNHVFQKYDLIKECNRHIMEKIIFTSIRLILISPLKK